MYQNEAFRDKSKESRLLSSRLVFCIFIALLLFFLLLFQLARLQIVGFEHYSTLSTDNRIKLTALPPPRGLIYDRNGVILADNFPTYRLEIIPSNSGDVRKTIEKLRNIITISDYDIKKFTQALRRKKDFQSIPIKFNLTNEEVAKFSVDRHLFPGVDIVAQLTRNYPKKDFASHALGHVGRINESELRTLNSSDYRGTTYIGKLGIEKAYEKILHGKTGFQHVEINAQGRVLRVFDKQSPVPGSDVYLTIDSKLQSVAEKALQGYEGSIVAMDPLTGDILAFASMPGYDPNIFVHGVSSKIFGSLERDSRHPLFNRAIGGQYPPGSTIKPLIALAGLEYGATTTGRTIFAGPYFKLPDQERRYKDWKEEGHGWVDLSKAIIQSCDVYFYDLAYRLGINRIHNFLSQFGLGKTTLIDFPGEATGILPSREWKKKTMGTIWFPGETVITGIGQGYMLTTPLQLATLTSVIATKGRRFRPRFLLGSENRINDVLKIRKPVELARISLESERNWDNVIKAMIGVNFDSNGTARRTWQNTEYSAAGKTGTAQVVSLDNIESYDKEKLSKHLKDHSLFIGFAPIKEPKIAVAVVVEHGGTGSERAAPIAKKVIDTYILGSTDL